MQKLPLAVRALVLLISTLFASLSMAEGEFLLGVQDYSKSPRLMALEYRDMSKYLSTRLGRPVIVEAVQSYDRYMERAKQKRYAFMFGPPSMAAEANALAGYEPVAKVPGTLSAAFMSLADGDIAFPEDMKGKTIGMPDEHSLMTKLAYAKLREMKIEPREYFSNVMVFNDANDVISAMKLGLVDIGVANSSLYNVWSAQGYNLNLVLQSKGVPHLTFAVRGDLSAETKARLAEALFSAHKDPVLAKGFFKRTGYPNFEAANLKDYAGLRGL